jgi:hypothetical protein
VTKSLAEIAGAQARALRLAADKSLEDVATAARSYGLRWSTGSVGDFEGGRATTSLKTLLVVAAVLRDLTGRPITLADLFAGNGPVEITENLPVDLSELRDMLAGQPVRMLPEQVVRITLKLSVPPDVIWPERLRGWHHPELHKRVLDALSESDVRMCKNIGVEPFVGAAAMAKLWGQTFTAERDDRAGLDANAQRRGRISRQLKAELQELIS